MTARRINRSTAKKLGNNLSQSIKIKAAQRKVFELLSSYDNVILEQKYIEIMNTESMGKTRRFRADYFLPNLKIFIELNGGQWIQGGHNRGGKSYEKDLTKINLAQRNGFQVWQYTYEMISRGELKHDLEQWKNSKNK